MSLRQSEQKDIIWGKIVSPGHGLKSTAGLSQRGQEAEIDEGGYGDDYDDFGDGDDNDDDGGSFFDGDVTVKEEDLAAALSASSLASGLGIQVSGGLLQAQRKVEKISIG
jgi:hypothetical protein